MLRHFPKTALLLCSLMGISVITAYYTYFLTAPTGVTNEKVPLQQNCRLSATGSSHTAGFFGGALWWQFIQTQIQWSLLISHFLSLLPICFFVSQLSLQYVSGFNMSIWSASGGPVCIHPVNPLTSAADGWLRITLRFWGRLSVFWDSVISLAHTVDGHVLKAYSTVIVLYVASDKNFS